MRPDREYVLLQHLYADHAGPLLTFVLRLTNGDRLRAEDVVQETILRAWRNAHKLSTCGDRSLRPWLVTVARRIAIDGYRVDVATREVREQDLETGGYAEGPERIVEKLAMNEAL